MIMLLLVTAVYDRRKYDPVATALCAVICMAFGD
jgi:hypothetical protein